MDRETQTGAGIEKIIYTIYKDKQADKKVKKIWKEIWKKVKKIKKIWEYVLFINII